MAREGEVEEQQQKDNSGQMMAYKIITFVHWSPHLDVRFFDTGNPESKLINNGIS